MCGIMISDDHLLFKCLYEPKKKQMTYSKILVNQSSRVFDLN